MIKLLVGLMIAVLIVVVNVFFFMGLYETGLAGGSSHDVGKGAVYLLVAASILMLWVMSQDSLNKLFYGKKKPVELDRE